MSRNPFSSDWLRRPRRAPAPAGHAVVRGGADRRSAAVHHDLAAARRRRRGARRARRGDLRSDRHALSWYDLQRRADEVAAGLLALGVQRGDRVGIWAPNRDEWLLTQFGTARIGAILVNINPAYRSSELEYALNKVQCRVLIMARALKSSDYLAMLRGLAPEIDRAPPRRPAAHASRLPHLRHVVLLGDGPVPAGVDRLQRVPSRSPGPAQRVAARLDLSAALDPDDAINIQFTSGTTGAPKGATLTPLQHRQQRALRAQAMALSERDRLCIPVPLYHCFGMVLGVLAACRRARRWCSRARASTPSRHADAVAAHSVHRAARRADDVHRDARAPALRAVRPVERCAPASWPARRARSRRCAAWSPRCTCARSRSPTA